MVLLVWWWWNLKSITMYLHKVSFSSFKNCGHFWSLGYIPIHLYRLLRRCTVWWWVPRYLIVQYFFKSPCTVYGTLSNAKTSMNYFIYLYLVPLGKNSEQQLSFIIWFGKEMCDFWWIVCYFLRISPLTHLLNRRDFFPTFLLMSFQ